MQITLEGFFASIWANRWARVVIITLSATALEAVVRELGPIDTPLGRFLLDVLVKARLLLMASPLAIYKLNSRDE